MNITQLKNNITEISQQINKVMIAAYRVEAKILNSTDFPPLKRTIENIRSAKTVFFGININSKIAAIIELEICPDKTINIDSLAVLPKHFRKGFGRALIQHCFSRYTNYSFLVATGLQNFPAISLYKSLGFIEKEQWETPCGIKMISLARQPQK